MYIKEIKTAKDNRSRCYQCKEPIIKREGIISFSSNKYYCYKCAKKWLTSKVMDYDNLLRKLRDNNHRSEEKLNEMKIAKML